MGKFTLVVMSNPAAGRENDYNAWYTDQHLPDVLRVPGFRSARRLRMVGQPMNGAGAGWKYCAFYEVEHDNPEQAMADLVGRSGTPDMPLSDALDDQMFVALFEPIAELSN